ncbi:MAG: ABC transporter permease [Anaerolineae bacterium]|nr:ABC transporter permease [Anaerolineae bacterium]
MILKNLWRRKTRTLLTVLGIAIGVAAVVSLGAIGAGIVESYGSILSNPTTDITVSQKDAIDISFSALDEDLLPRIQAVPGVEVVDPVVVGFVQSENLPFFIVFGYETDSLAIRRYNVVEGKPITGQREILLGMKAAEDLKLGVGGTVRLYGVPYQIVGIYETGQALEEGGGVVSLAEAQEIASKPRQVNAFQIKTRRPDEADAVIERLQTLFPDLSISKGSGNSAAQEWVGMIQAMAWGIAAIAIIVGGLGMMNTMVMSVFERTREIGVLRALGWRRGRVMRLILSEAVVLSILGGLLGVLLGVALVQAAASMPGYGALMTGRYSAGLFAQGMLTAILLGTVGGIYPAWWASKLTPIEALRYEGGASGSSRRRKKSDESAAASASRLPPALRDLGRRKVRTVLTVLGIGVGVAAIVALNGISEGMIQQLNQFAGGSSMGDLTLMQRGVPDMSLSAIDERVGRAIGGMPEVESVSGMVLGFSSQPGMPFFIISGLDPNSPAMRHFTVAEGRHIQRPNEMLLGRAAANALKKGVGDTMQVLNGSYRIVGVFETGVGYEESGGVFALSEAQAILNRPRQVSYLLVDVRNPQDVEYVRQAVEQRFEDVKASVSTEFAQNTDDIQTLQSMTGAIILMALIVGGIVILNTMIMTIYERTREIGTLRALGWRKRRILSTVVREAVLLSALAGVAGILMGIGMIELAALAPAAAYLQGTFTSQALAETMVIAIGLGVLGGLYPAWRASRLSPVEALRYE